MSSMKKRLQKLEVCAGEVWEPPAIIHWMVNPQDPEAWAVALVRDGNSTKTLRRRSGETIERFKARADRVAEQFAAKAGARIGTSADNAQITGGPD